MNRRFLSWPLAALLTAALPAVAQPSERSTPPPEALPGTFGEVLEVRVINVEVVVTDRDGVRVHGLAPDDFRLLVDGQETPIEYFTEIRGGTALDFEAAPGVEGVPTLQPGASVGTRYLVFIDDFFSVSRDRDAVLRQLIEDLELLGPDDRMAVVAWDGQDLEMLSSWEGSREALRRTFEEARSRPASGLQRLVERRRFDADDTIFDVGSLILAGDLGNPINLATYLTVEEQFYANLLASQVERSVMAAAATLRGFAQPPGRRVMILLSGGWPFLPADFVVADLARPLLDRNVPGGGALFRPLTDTANQLGYTIFPVDVPGLDRQVVDVSRDAPRSSVLQGDDFLREQEVHFALEFLAEKTGGEALINSRRREALSAVVEDTRSYYWLGFSPRWKGDDSRHDVRVEVRDPGLRARFRSGYLDSSLQRETTMRVESALLFGSPPSGEPLRLEFGRPSKAGIGKMEVPLTIYIPLDEVTFLPSQGKHLANLELRVAVLDDNGQRADIPVIPLPLELAAPPEEGKVFRYETTLKMRRQRHEAVVAVFDPLGGRMLSGTAVITP